MVSILLRPTLAAAADVAVHHAVVDQRSKHVAEEDGEHHALGVAGVHHAHHNGHDADERTIDPLTTLGTGRGDRVGGHEDGTEAETAEHDVLIPGDAAHAQLLEDHGHQTAAEEHAQHGLPGGNARPQQDHGANGDGDDGGLAHGSRDETDDHVVEAGGDVGVLSDLTQRSGHRVAVGALKPIPKIGSVATQMVSPVMLLG